MKKYSFFLMLCSFFPAAYAQLYVSPNNFLYAKNTVMYVKQDINLQSNSNIYLRNESQLVQGTSGLSANTGTGKVSVFQEGLTNQYGYHYWCSPVGDPNASGSSNNKSFNISMFRVPLAPPANNIGPPSNAVSIRPVSERASVAATASLEITPRWVYKLVPSVTLGWIGPNPTMNPGEGFTMKGVDGTDLTIAEDNEIKNNPGNIAAGGQRYEFSGRPNDGNITVNVVASKITLTGNPYPSALDLNAFLLDASNNACTGIAYFWEYDPTSNTHLRIYKRGGYGSYSPLTGEYAPAAFNTYNLNGSINTTGPSSGRGGLKRRYSPIGQGFVIEGRSTVPTGTVTFKNSYRVYEKEGGASESILLRSAGRGGSDNSRNQKEENKVSVIRFSIIVDNDYTRQIVLAFLPEATDGVDRGMDAKNPAEDGLLSDASFLIDNNSYVIQGVNFDVNKKIPLLIKAAANSTFKFTISEIKNFDETQDIYLHDIENNTYHNLKASDYTVNISTAGTFKDRFEITFKSSSAALSNNQFSKDSFTIVQNNTNKMLTVYNPQSADIKSVLVYDITGKLFSQYNNLGTKASYQFPTSGMSTGVYLVKLTDTANKTFTQKIIVNEMR